MGEQFVNQRLWTKSFISVAAANFFTFATFYYLLVTLPLYALQDLHGKETAVGLLIAIFLIAAIVTRPFAGKWIGKAGKRIVFLSSLIILFGSSALYFIPHSMTALLVLRFVHGIGFGMATTAAGAIVADIIPDSRKGEGMGYYGLTLNLAMVIGPFLGLTVMQYAGANVMFTINLLGSLFALIAGLFVKLPERSATDQLIERNKNKGFKSLFEISAVPIALVSAFFALVYATIIAFVSVYAKEIGLVEASSYFFVVYAVVLLLSRPFTGKWFDLYGGNKIIYPGILCFAIGTYLLSISTTAFMFLLSAGLIGLGWGTVFPSLQTIAIQNAPVKNRGLATATFLSIFDLGFGVGSFLVGLIATKMELGRLYFYCSILVSLGIGVYYALHGRFSSIALSRES
ncbi:MFS transporter [Bacillus canaveralius]|uniref:MFS transporter n=1 Tax=Bacillus canaveralius TaxID=1403243 RepID=A0A2N5GHU3_9BACI|nr:MULTISPECIES: MFS transporter [Bacillus]PLR80362.1 MFS transporter [Bacillus canaveralius]PLR85844.1 MFS transporter [Bacillus sp. V33-4]PLR95495.1 MFS transporter [Bacillus canaveralius]